MKALTYHGSKDVRVDTVPDPTIVDPTDVILKITLSAICGSDLHIYDGLIPTMEKGDILGHEFMGEVVEVGADVKRIKKGDRVVIPFPIACGTCFFCKSKLWSLCDNSNPNKKLADTMFGYSPSGIFGYSHLFGGFAGGQAQYVRVPYADVGAQKIPEGLEDKQVLFLSDVFPTGYMAAENANIQKGDTVAVWGCGPVGQFAIRSAFMFGAGRVIAIDRLPERLAMAKDAGAETINYDENPKVFEALRDMTKGRGPDSAIDAVGMEAHGDGVNKIAYVYDKVKQSIMPGVDRITALRQVIHSVRKGGTVSIIGVYAGLSDKLPTGIMFNKGLTLKMGQAHVHRYMPMLLDKVQKGEIDPSFLITHVLPLIEAPQGYKMFRDKEDGCIKVVLDPFA